MVPSMGPKKSKEHEKEATTTIIILACCLFLGLLELSTVSIGDMTSNSGFYSMSDNV